ncbi:MAG TPA: dockerin type I domain-containing protein [Phycisphaerales bacterium]|nr:dockerin type I domain-containing protein [Phycisphaerales bacterium]
MNRCFVFAPSALLCVFVTSSAFSARHLTDDAFADVVVSYTAGTGAGAYTNPMTALGSPERFTGEGVFPSCVTPFNPTFGLDEIVSIGAGGQLTLKFNTPVTDDPNNPYGIDLIIFGNTGFSDANYPNGIVSAPFDDPAGTVQVSADGANWHTIPGASADWLFPTLGYNDAILYETSPGSSLTDFTRPIDPRLTLNDVLGLNSTQLGSLYHESGGGQGIDLASVGLTSVSYIRFSNSSSSNIPEIDAVADVSPRIPGDVNFDGVVNIDDLTQVILAWGINPHGGIPADFNNDGVVNIDDLTAVILHWS